MMRPHPILWACHVQTKDGSTTQAKDNYRQRVWGFIVKKEIPKMGKQFATSRHNTFITNKKVRNMQSLVEPAESGQWPWCEIPLSVC